MSNVWIKHPRNNEKFTFPPHFIQNISDGFELEVEQNKMPGMGPMRNQGFIMNGIGKTIQISGVLIDTTSSVISEVSPAKNMQDKQLMKLWLESLSVASMFKPVEFSIPFGAVVAPFTTSVAASGIGDTEFVDSVTGTTIVIPALFVATKGYIIAQSFNPIVGEPDKIDFSMTFWLSGF